MRVVVVDRPAPGGFAFSPDEARDDHGRWSEGGGGDSSATEATKTLAGGYRLNASGGFKAEPWQTADPKLLTPEWSAQRQAARDWAGQHVHSTKDASVGSYVAGSSGINSALRNGDAPPEFMDAIQPVLKGIDGEIAASHVDVNTVAFRGQPLDVLAGKQVGDTFTDKGYTSTSLLARSAGGFGGRQEDDERYGPKEGQTVEVHIPAGSNVGVPADRTEDELDPAPRLHLPGRLARR